MLTVILVQLKTWSVCVCLHTVLLFHDCVCRVACSAAAALRFVLVGAVPGQQVAFPVFICFILLSKP